VHGRIDADHVRLDEGGVMLLFSTSTDALASRDLDSIALARLGRAVR
jgi:hypothetical protein